MITQEDKDKLIATLTLQLKDKDKEIDELNRFIEKLMFYIGEHCDVCKQPFCTQGSPRLPNSPLIIFGTFEGCPENCHICIEQYIKEDYEIFEKEFDNMQKELDEKDQDKISFAVEQINKIKNDLYENEKINIRVCDIDEIDNIFNNQIKQLTHQHEDKGDLK